MHFSTLLPMIGAFFRIFNDLRVIGQTFRSSTREKREKAILKCS
jgi:hypothetical protein